MADQEEVVMSATKRKSSKTHYVDFKKLKRMDCRVCLRPGLQGVMLTCNNNQNRGALGEIYELLNEAADSLYGDKESGASPTQNSEANADPSIGLDEEVAALKERWTKPQRFQPIDTGVKNIYFIQCIIGEPYELTKWIFRDLIERKASVRFCQRLIPVTLVCHSTPEDIKRSSSPYLKNYFQSDVAKECKFAIAYKCRFNSKIERKEVIATVADIVVDGKVKHNVDLDHADVVVVIEIIKNLCCISILEDFHEMRKYNLNEVARHGRSDKHKASMTDSNDESVLQESTGDAAT